LTTHSSAALDLFGTSESAQIIHVTHDSKSATAVRVDGHFERLGILGELGAKPSDILQANGIVWVEGPSDAIYLNRWIGLVSGGELREGRNYLCAFYGGALLARTQFVSPDKADEELVNLLQINPNVVVMCDGDLSSKRSNYKPRVIRIRDEMERVPGAVTWITETKEIENYLTGEILGKALGLSGNVQDPLQYQTFFPGMKKGNGSYLEDVLGRSGIDKIELAVQCNAHTEPNSLHQRFDWQIKMESVVAAIRRWNR
jgi:hypothetical protein